MTLYVMLYFASVLCAVLGAISISNTIDYQSHSVDDLREWPQLLAKGMIVSKIDVFYMPHILCSLLPHEIYGPKIFNDTRGCFLLTHDFPVFANPSYNTIFDLFSFISDAKYSRYFRNSQRRFYLALCFKSGGECGDQNWISLVDDIYDLYNKLVKEIPDLNVEFILDGSAAPSKPCFYDKWRPWVSTWINNPPQALFSNDPKFAYDRFQVLNPSVDENNVTKNILELQKQRYGKFLNGKYTFLTWEPSNQVDILAVIDAYLSAPDLINKNGLRFATNLDPKMFEIYAGSRTNRAWNAAYGSNRFRPFFTSVDLIDTYISFLNVFTTCDTCHDLRYTIYITDKVLGKLNVFAKDQSLNTTGTPLNTLTSLDSASINGVSLIIMSDTESHYAIFRLNKDTSMTALTKGLLTRDSKPSTAGYSASSLYTDGQDLFIAALSYDMQSLCELMLTVWQIQASSSKMVSSTCLRSIAVGINHVTIDITVVNGSTYGIVFWSTQDKKIYACYLQGDYSTMHGNCSTVPFGIGTAPSVSVTSTNPNFIPVMEVHTDAFCYNSDDRNRQAWPSVCDLHPIPESQMLAYNYGSWQGFKEQITTGKQPVSSCHDWILHGTYDMGSHPNVELYVVNNTVGMIATHEAISDTSGEKKCGRPVQQQKGTVMIDAWSLEVY